MSLVLLSWKHGHERVDPEELILLADGDESFRERVGRSSMIQERSKGPRHTVGLAGVIANVDGTLCSVQCPVLRE